MANTPVPPPACPPATTFDVRSTDCRQTLSKLFTAYAALTSGQQRVEVRFNERWITYGKGNTADLITLYRMLYNQCPGAKAAGLPELNPGLRAQRGPAARGFQVWPRL